MFNRILQIAAALLLLSGLMSFFSAKGWLFDLASHFPVQYVLALLPLSVVAAARKLRITFVVLLATLTFNITTLAKTEWLVDREHIATNIELEGTPYRLMTLNVLTRNNEFEKISDLIEEKMPDSVLILELTPALVDYLKAHLSDYPYFFGQPLMRAAGIGVFSRRPMKHAELLAIGNKFKTAIHIEQELQTSNNGKHDSIRLFGAHPVAPVSSDMYQLRSTQLRQLSTIATKFDKPLIIAGDFNITPWSSDFQSLLKVGNLADSRVGFGIQGTWPWCLPFLSIPIDHLLTSPGITVRNRYVVRIEGSDHCGVVADLLVN